VLKMVAREGIEPPTRGFSILMHYCWILRNHAIS